MDQYTSATGQLINEAKCSIMFADVCVLLDSARGSKNTLGVVSEEFEDLYLGLPVLEGRMNIEKNQALQASLSKRFFDLGEKQASSGVKETLIKSIAQGIPTYMMSVFKLPASTCEDLTRIIRGYWWAVKNGKHRMHWTALEKLIRPKNQGGLGFRDMWLFNQALLARQAWRLIDRLNSLCARLLKARYYR